MINLASDLDGTIYKGNQLINGVEETYKLLIKKKVNIIFTTNNSSQSPDVLKLKLEDLLNHKIDIENIITPLKLFKFYVDPSKYKLYVYGSNNLKEFLQSSNYNLTSLEKSNAILIGRKDHLDVNEIEKIINIFFLDDSQKKDATNLIKALYKILIQKDANLIEINPLIITKKGKVLCLEETVFTLEAKGGIVLPSCPIYVFSVSTILPHLLRSKSL
mgnify:CR=1 FL=1